MKKQEKNIVIGDIKNNFENNNVAFIVNYQGLTVAKVQALRADLKKEQSTLKIAKNRLVKIAIKNSVFSADLNNFLKEQSAFVFSKNNLSGAAKSLLNFSKTNESLKIIAGVYENKVLNSVQILEVAKLPSKEVLIAKFLFMLKYPILSLVNVLNNTMLKLILTLKAIEENKKNNSNQ